jgi:hypothetical protein
VEIISTIRSVRECTLNNLLQHCPHMWFIWALFYYNIVTHIIDSYKTNLCALWWFVDEGTTLNKAIGCINNFRLPTLRPHGSMQVPSINRISFILNIQF